GELARDHLVGRLHEQLRLLGRELAQFLVDLRGRLLEDRHAPDHRGRHAVFADREVVQRPLGLRAPVTVGGDLDRSHAVGLGPGVACGFAHAPDGTATPSQITKLRRSYVLFTSWRRNLAGHLVQLRSWRTRRTWRSMLQRTYGPSSPAPR